MTSTTIPTPKSRTTTCKKCGDPITWKKSTRTGRMYPSEACLRRGYTGKMFPSSQPHRCVVPVDQPLNTEPPSYVYGKPLGPVEDPTTHEHRWMPWRNVPGGITGSWCQGCRSLMID